MRMPQDKRKKEVPKIVFEILLYDMDKRNLSKKR